MIVWGVVQTLPSKPTFIELKMCLIENVTHARKLGGVIN